MIIVVVVVVVVVSYDYLNKLESGMLVKPK
jgi:hypothetical protein